MLPITYFRTHLKGKEGFLDHLRPNLDELVRFLWLQRLFSLPTPLPLGPHGSRTSLCFPRHTLIQKIAFLTDFDHFIRWLTCFYGLITVWRPSILGCQKTPAIFAEAVRRLDLLGNLSHWSINVGKQLVLKHSSILGLEHPRLSFQFNTQKHQVSAIYKDIAILQTL